MAVSQREVPEKGTHYFSVFRTSPPSSLLPDLPGGGSVRSLLPNFFSRCCRNRGMPRRIAGTIWAIRITMDISPTDEASFKIPGTVCVFHAGGSRANSLFKEKPHYHLYYDAKRETTKDVVQALIKSNSIVQAHYKASNGFWSVETDPGYDLESYWRYVWNDYPTKKQRLIWWDVDVPQLPGYPIPTAERTDIPIVSHVGAVVAQRVVKKSTKTSLEKQQLFYEFCKDWYDDNEEEITKHRICMLLVDYCKNAGFTPESSLSTWARFAYFKLLPPDSYKLAVQDLAQTLENKFF